VIKASIIPFLFACDINGGIMNLGFTRTEIKQEFKAKPDYLTGKLFVANRADFKSL